LADLEESMQDTKNKLRLSLASVLAKGWSGFVWMLKIIVPISLLTSLLALLDTCPIKFLFREHRSEFNRGLPSEIFIQLNEIPIQPERSLFHRGFGRKGT
jgi:hypothetical protein